MGWDILAALFTILSVNIGLFLNLGGKIDSFRNELNIRIDSLRNEVTQEMKDFHGRLCSLEARYHDEKYKKVDK